MINTPPQYASNDLRSGTFQPLAVTHAVLSLDCGGLERIVLDLVREGQQLGQRVTILCLERPGTLASEAEALGARVDCVSKPPGLRLGIVRRLRDVLRERQPDVVHTHQIGPLFYLAPAARAIGVPVVVHTEHGKHYARAQTRWLGRWAARSATRFFCVSRDIADDVRVRRIVAADRIEVLANGIDIARFRPDGSAAAQRSALGIPAAAPVVGTVGRLDEVKCQDVLLRAFARLRQRVPDAHLLIVGDGPLRNDLRRLADSLELGGGVHFAGFQAQPERFLQVMNLFALASRSEGLPLAILEAWAAGVPVVASQVGGVPELIEQGRTGLLVPAGDVAALLESLMRLIENPQLASALSAAGQQRVEESFSLHRMAVAYHQRYCALLGQRAERMMQP